MRIGDIGEFGLIERISRLLPAAPESVVVGVGDDVAVLRTSGSDYLLATCDIQVETVHFLRTASTPYQVGKKAIAINLSDIAAMGGVPGWVLVSLALPQEVPVEFVDELYKGMSEQAQAGGAAIVGGNLSRAVDRMVIDIFLMGQVAPEHLVLRKGAKEGDLIVVTGTPGDSRAGLELIQRPELQVSQESAKRATAAHLTPQPRIGEGQALARSGRVHAMVDVSDGLLADLSHICKAGGVGARVLCSELPVSPACIEVARAAGRDPVDWALSGGEDYELLFTVAPEDAPLVRQILDDRGGASCRVIGRVLPPSEGTYAVLPDGSTIRKAGSGAGWDHFASR